MTAVQIRGIEFPSVAPEIETFDGEKAPWMSGFSDEYGAFLQRQVDRDVACIPDRIMAMLAASDALVQGMQVTQLEHGLETATMAERAGMDVDIVVAALCHDMSKVISTPNHAAIAAEMIKPFVTDDAYWMVKVHQDFEGIHYLAQIGVDPMIRLQHKDHPAYELAERFADEWDVKAFDPDFDMSPLEHFEPMVREVFSRKAKRPDHWVALNPAHQ
ncbi:MAG: HD domain-containing protein [Jatrophihabitantaceae bacterium]